MNTWKISTLGLAAWLGATAGTSAIRPAAAEQGNMQAALSALNNAKGSLQRAVPDKAGHREKAKDLVDQAITEVNEGITAGAK